MRVTPNDDERSVSELAVRFFHDRVPLAGRAGRSEPRATWSRQVFAEMGRLDFFTPFGLGEEGPDELSGLTSGLIVEAAGRELAAEPIIDHLLATRLLVARATPPRTPFGPDAVAVAGLADASASALRLDPVAGAVSGTVRALSFGDEVDRWVLPVSDVDPGGAIAVVVLDPRGPGVQLQDDEASVDLLYRSCSAVLERAPVLHRQPMGRAEFEIHRAYALGLVAAYSAGASRRLLDDTVAYVREREQFGRPIGSFQAVKHKLATAYAKYLHARCLTYAALAQPQVRELRLARIAADRAYRLMAETALQLHGGIGFTAESTVHLFLRNAQRLRGWPTPVHHELDRLRQALGLCCEPAPLAAPALGRANA